MSLENDIKKTHIEGILKSSGNLNQVGKIELPFKNIDLTTFNFYCIEIREYDGSYIEYLPKYTILQRIIFDSGKVVTLKDLIEKYNINLLNGVLIKEEKLLATKILFEEKDENITIKRILNGNEIVLDSINKIEKYLSELSKEIEQYYTCRENIRKILKK